MINGAPMGHQGLHEIEVRYFMSQIISALEYLYQDSVRIVHRDLSLNNIFLGHNFDDMMQIKLGDFGMSIRLPENQRERRSNSFLGTTRFMPPELFESLEDGTHFRYSQKNDIWSLGVIFYQLLTGSSPFAC